MFWQSAPAIAQADAPEPALSEQSDADQPFASDAAAILLFGKNFIGLVIAGFAAMFGAIKRFFSTKAD